MRNLEAIAEAARAAGMRRAAPDAAKGSAAVFIGSVTEAGGEQLSAYWTPNGSVIVAGDLGTCIAFDRAGLAEYRELLDRAGMPGLEG
jgi:hypothetical protein